MRAIALAALLALACSHAAPPMTAEDRQLVADVERIAGARAAEDKFSGVVLVAQKDDILFERAYGLADRATQRRNTAATRFDLASVSKMFTGVAIMQLVERGKLDLDQPVGAYLPAAFRNGAIRNSITAHHLLTHTAGLPAIPDEIFHNPPPALSGWLPFFESAELQFAPGSQRAYSNGGFILLGLIIETVSGEPYEQYVRKHVFAPARMTGTVFRAAAAPAGTASTGYSRKNSNEWQPNTGTVATTGGPHGGAYSTAADLARFFHALRTGKLLRPETARLATTPRPGIGAAYAFGVLDFDSDRLVGHSGGSVGISTDAYTYWQSGYTIVVLSNYAAPASHEVAGEIRKLIEPRFTAGARDGTTGSR